MCDNEMSCALNCRTDGRGGHLRKFAWPLAKGVSRSRLPTFFSSTNRFFDSLFFHYLIYQVYPARARAAPGGSRRQSLRDDRGRNVRQPPFSRFFCVFALLLRFSKFLFKIAVLRRFWPSGARIFSLDGAHKTL